MTRRRVIWVAKNAVGTIAKGQKYRVDSLPERNQRNRFSTKGVAALENRIAPFIFAHAF